VRIDQGRAERCAKDQAGRRKRDYGPRGQRAAAVRRRLDQERDRLEPPARAPSERVEMSITRWTFDCDRPTLAELRFNLRYLGRVTCPAD
jgi:hypothetical protein